MTGATISRQLPALGDGELCVSGSGRFQAVSGRGGSVVVPVAVVLGVAVPVVDVVDVVAVQHALVSAVLAVLVGVLLVGDVGTGLAFVPVAAVFAVQVAVVGVVDVVAVGTAGWPQAGPWAWVWASCSRWRVVMGLTFGSGGGDVRQGAMGIG